jgi:hypothetical protein
MICCWDSVNIRESLNFDFFGRYLSYSSNEVMKLWRIDGWHTRPAARGPEEAHGGAWLAAGRRGAQAAGRLPELLLPASMRRCCRWPPPRAPTAGHLHAWCRGLLLFTASDTLRSFLLVRCCSSCSSRVFPLRVCCLLIGLLVGRCLISPSQSVECAIGCS